MPLPPFSVGSPYTFTWKSRSEQTKQCTLNSTQSATPLGNGEMGKSLTVRETFYGKQSCMWGNSYCQGRMTLHWLSQQIITKFSIFILLLESIVWNRWQILLFCILMLLSGLVPILFFSLSWNINCCVTLKLTENVHSKNLHRLFHNSEIQNK